MDRVTKFDKEYADELAFINRQLIEDEGHQNQMSVGELAERMQAWLTGEYSCYGMVDSGEIIAYCLFRDDGEYYYIRQLFTVRECRRKGLALTLMRYLEEQIFAGKPVRLEVLSGNSQAMQFYSKMGYEVYSHTLVKNV